MDKQQEKENTMIKFGDEIIKNLKTINDVHVRMHEELLQKLNNIHATMIQGELERKKESDARVQILMDTMKKGVKKRVTKAKPKKKSTEGVEEINFQSHRAELK